ncbi:WYL domain-containing protein [Streptomyces sp. NPDC048506]|uniref:helix-turn-helix transcriptional regulator n=1 Tax=Streptomyces sp. NPDC048506 TaxID=3155028 RepID=UPI00343949F0
MRASLPNRHTDARRGEPHALVASGDLWYLLAHDTDKGDWRLFRLDRITHPTPTGRRVPPRQIPGGDPAAFVAERISAAPTRYRAIATVHAPADHVRARGLATRLHPLDDTACRLDASDDALPRIARTLAGLDVDYTLDADPAVLDHLRTAAHRTLRATG